MMRNKTARTYIEGQHRMAHEEARLKIVTEAAPELSRLNEIREDHGKKVARLKETAKALSNLESR
jgi:hypothetical protein